MPTPSNQDNLIDSRDIIARLEDLQARRDDEDRIDPLNDDEAAELVVLEKLNDAGESFREWASGITMIRDSYFAQYIEQDYPELHEGFDLNVWPFNHIDWDAAADEVMSDDYSEIEFDGVTYYTSAQ
jgi:hypothetical protein